MLDSNKLIVSKSQFHGKMNKIMAVQCVCLRTERREITILYFYDAYCSYTKDVAQRWRKNRERR